MITWLTGNIAGTVLKYWNLVVLDMIVEIRSLQLNCCDTYACINFNTGSYRM